MNASLFWFAYRQVNEEPFGAVVVEGPFDSRKEAEQKMGSTTDWDMQYSGPFLALSREEAEQKAANLFT